MVDKTLTARDLTLSLAAGLGATLLALLVAGPLAMLEEPVTTLRYQIRGPVPADSSIVIVYLDNESARSLGWPIRRNYYALMISTLSQLGAKAVGVEVLFEQPGTEYTEYDDVLAEMIGRAGNVVLPGYYRTLKIDKEGEWFGEEFHRPFPLVGSEAAAVGHLNFVEGARIPLQIKDSTGTVSAFGYEILHAAGRVPPGFLPSGTAELNFPGGLSSFLVYPFVEVLRSFDAIESGRPPGIPLDIFHGRLVLVGVIAEGRSSFLNTPVGSRYPSIGVHAVMIDNILNDRFLRTADALVSGAVSLFLAGILMLVILMGKPGIIWFAGLEMSLVLILSQVLFTTAHYVLPVIPILFPLLVVALAGSWYRFRVNARSVTRLEFEKESIAAQLKQREETLKDLESELTTARSARSSARAEELLSEIRRQKEEIRSLTARADDLVESELPPEGDEVISFEGILGSAKGPVKGIVGLIEKVAQSDAPVLILGESGTGKELVARALHRKSARKENAFIAVNCGALSETLLESELFGHEKGAFTGAVGEKAGRFERADGGTIFLDEIGEVTESFQVKLLRVLQEGEFERVGGTTTLRVNVRVLAATNRDLKQQIAGRKFREDLYYRLNVLSIELPPLRDRDTDLPVLINHFLNREGPGLALSRIVLDTMRTYRWPGNIRELESVIKRGALLARAESSSMITLKHLSDDIRSAAEGLSPLEERILQSMREKQFSRRSVTETAEELGGLNRGTVAEYLRGEFLKAFLEHQFDMNATIQFLSPSGDPGTAARVTKRLSDYLGNIVDAVDRSAPWSGTSDELRPKMKNLPQQYHDTVIQVASAFHRGDWQL